ncbi:MAG: hypothetical protein ABSC77_11160 [Terracidiphilus sp.]|jgi:lipid A disaccharide synthetase
MSPTIFIPAGEASGEHYGALVIDALKKRLAASGQLAQFFGMGGQPLVYGQSITDPASTGRKPTPCSPN